MKAKESFSVLTTVKSHHQQNRYERGHGLTGVQESLVQHGRRMIGPGVRRGRYMTHLDKEPALRTPHGCTGISGAVSRIMHARHAIAFSAAAA
jgi:hypothetical protein